jgi:hypothetical protein
MCDRAKLTKTHDIRPLGIVLSVAFLIGVSLVACAPQSPTPPANTAPVSGAPHPASWYYDPYTNGASACPEGGPGGDPKCHILIPSSYPAR